MSLIVDVTIPYQKSDRSGGVSVGVLRISRLTKLDQSRSLADQVHPYVATLEETFTSTTATLNHRYGDGAWVLISNALAALNYPENKDVR